MQAFCGFYGARADNKLFNRASTVVHTRGNDTPVITMLSEFRGSPAEFVMIVPTAKVLDRSLETTVPSETIPHLDRHTAPRLVEYFDEDPCAPLIVEEMVMEVAPGSAPTRRKRARAQARLPSPSNANSPSALMTFRCFRSAS